VSGNYYACTGGILKKLPTDCIIFRLLINSCLSIDAHSTT
jgi:hypothetical protein